MEFPYHNQRVLILAPHADDEVIGCGGVIQKFLKAKSNVRIIIASFVEGAYRKFYKEKNQYQNYDGKVRFEEMKTSHETLGVTDFRFLYTDHDHVQYHSQLDTLPKIELVTKLEEEISDYQPTVIFIPSQTKHQDHTAMHDAALAAVRPYFWNGSIFVYETDGELNFNPHFFVPLTEEEAQIKAEALKAYKTQLGPSLHPVNPDVLLIKARYRGQSIYTTYAESFEVKRWHG